MRNINNGVGISADVNKAIEKMLNRLNNMTERTYDSLRVLLSKVFIGGYLDYESVSTSEYLTSSIEDLEKYLSNLLGIQTKMVGNKNDISIIGYELPVYEAMDDIIRSRKDAKAITLLYKILDKIPVLTSYRLDSHDVKFNINIAELASTDYLVSEVNNSIVSEVISYRSRLMNMHGICEHAAIHMGKCKGDTYLPSVLINILKSEYVNDIYEVGGYVFFTHLYTHTNDDLGVREMIVKSLAYTFHVLKVKPSLYKDYFNNILKPEINGRINWSDDLEVSIKNQMTKLGVNNAES